MEPGVIPAQRCVRCVMDTTDPGIRFGADGVCSHCHSYDAHFRGIVTAAAAGERLGELTAIADKIKASGRLLRYDCVVGVSGGVDSSYVLLKAKELGLRPLAVHVDSGWNSEAADNNIKAITSGLGVDLKTEGIDREEMRDLQLAFFKAGVANCDIPMDHAFPAILLRNAVSHKVKYILSGSNFATESVLPTAWGHNSADLRYLKAIHDEHGGVRLRDYPTLGMWRQALWYPYIRGIKTVKVLNYVPYIKDGAKARIAELGWRDYGGKHYESVLTRFFQGYYLPVRFGYDKRLAHLSSLILSGQLTRADALSELALPTYDAELQDSDLRMVSDWLGLTTDELSALIAAPTDGVEHYPDSNARYALAFKVRDGIRRFARR
jgi:N-acetyl sugar amidotransferase